MLLTSLGTKNRQLLDSLMIVTPATLVGWHRQILGWHWAFRQKHKPGRPRLDSEAEQPILRIAGENPHWGYTKIAGEMRKLGFTGIGGSTAARILERHHRTPRPGHRGLSWHDFIGHYGQFMWACDFFVVTTATGRTYCVFSSVEISTRRIVFWKVSQHPDGAWVAQQFRNLSILHDDLPHHLLYDRDSKFAPHADALLGGMRTKPARLPIRSPNLNAHAERWIRTVREQCLDRIIVLNERDLRWVL